MKQVYQDLVDSHTHLLSMERRKLHVHTLLSDFFSQGYAYVIDVGIDGRDWDRRQAYAHEFPGVFLAEGIHPSESPAYDLKTLSKLKPRLQERKCVALGEIGLDYFRNPENRKIQLDLLSSQLDLAVETDKPVILHNREADEDMIAILKEKKLPRSGVFHCFSSTWDTARKALDLGFYISFAGNLTYPNAGNLAETAQKIPMDRLLIETDAPYLSPQAVRGKTNHPGNLQYTLEFLADLKAMSPGVLAKTIKSNAERLFHLGLS